jgi:hypothetical protein
LIPPWIELNFSNNKQLIGLKYSYIPDPCHLHSNELSFFVNKCEEKFKHVLESIKEYCETNKEEDE